MMYSEEFHRKSKNHISLPISNDEWPEEWKTIYFKTYPRLEHIPLMHSAGASKNLFSCISERSSARDFSKQSITLSNLSHILLYSCGIQSAEGRAPAVGGIQPNQHRAQPSGGGRFPIEVYVLNFVDGEIPSGVFHYDVKNHELSVLKRRVFTRDDIAELFVYRYVENASCAIIMTAMFSRAQNKYGERGYRNILLEAGHIGQNISLVSGALNLKSVMMAGSKDVEVEKLFDIDGVTESVVYTAIIGT